MISCKNCTSQTYIYNLKIENTCKYDQTIDFNNFEYPEYGNVIAYWPCLTDYKPQIINNAYLPSNYDYILNHQAVALGTSGDYATVALPNNFKTVSAQVLNVDPGKADNPGLFWFDNHFIIDNDNSIKHISNSIKDIIYNTNNNLPNTTLLFWGYQTINDANNNPIYSDYNYDTGNGLIISPQVVETSNVINKNEINDISTDYRETFTTDYSKYEDSILNHWVLYAIEFQHPGGKIPINNSSISTMAPWTYSKWKNDVEPDKMRINIRIVYSASQPVTLLLPTSNQLNNSKLNEFYRPNIENNININFFRNKKI